MSLRYLNFILCVTNTMYFFNCIRVLHQKMNLKNCIRKLIIIDTGKYRYFEFYGKFYLHLINNATIILKSHNLLMNFMRLTNTLNDKLNFIFALNLFQIQQKEN